MVGVGKVQVDGVKFQEWMWGAGVTERCYNDEQKLMGGGGRMEEGINTYLETVETGGAGRDRIKLFRISYGA